ncbi:estrogen sulfotransferase [Culex quinquefasciatus]|uniref:Estrogen sulfotransferase n=1 Tax=Culex quinquefasciatus TaxID=7176 RepID=B0X5K2_CULQU|nr:estrogen sulfotransferase [Culex quinquefasciatus]|eukprot:XP_001864924.1 estrogen sulfotransferase [Culex quinquefasciatus]
MSFQYTSITDPEWLATNRQTGQDDYILVKPTDYSNVPIAIPNWEPLPCCTSTMFRRYERELLNFQVKSDDVWIASYPKSGTTWVQEMVWLICNDLDFEKARTTVIRDRSPFLEVSTIFDIGEEESSFVFTSEAPSPRFIKTHLPVALLPPNIWAVKPKIVYIRRNPKSVGVSYFHHSVRANFNGTKEAFIRMFMKDLQFYSPFHQHVIEYNELASYDNLLNLCYEDMKRDLKSSVIRTCEFFDKNYSDETINELCRHLSFESMTNNLAVNYEDVFPDEKFIREGMIDGWKKELSPELIAEMDHWTENTVAEKYRHLFKV